MDSHNAGCLHLIYGPMFSGKTTELLRRVRRYSFAHLTTVVIKYRADVRYDVDNAVTHDKVSSPAVPAMVLSEVEQTVSQYDVIGIDEGQFFPDLVAFCNKWSNQGKIVIVAALDGTFQRKPFGNVLELIPMAEYVTKLSAVCMNCGRDAPFTHRTTMETAVEVIGGSDKYKSLCRACFLDEESARNRAQQ